MRLGLRRGQRGFTIVEMVIVIAIMGIIAAIVIPNVTDFLGSGKNESWDSDKDAIQVAVDSYYAAGNTADPLVSGTTKGAPVLTSASAFTTENGALNFANATLMGYLHGVPESASSLNGGSTSGAYVWYIDTDNTVNAVYWDSDLATPAQGGPGYWDGHYPD